MLQRLNLNRQHTMLEALLLALIAWVLVLMGSLVVAAPAVVYFSTVFDATGSEPYFYGVIATHALCACFSLFATVLAARHRVRTWRPWIVLVGLIGFVLSSCFGSPAAVLAPTLISLMPVQKEA